MCALGVIAAVGSVADDAEAQQAELAVSGGLVVDARGGERSGVGVSPALYWSGRDGELLTRGRVTLLGGGEALLGGSLAAVLRGGRVGLGDALLGLEVGGSGEASAASGWRSGHGRVWPRLAAEGADWRVAAGPVAGLVTERMGPTEPGRLLGPLGGGADRTSTERTRTYRGISAEARIGVGVAGSLIAGWSGLRSGEAGWQELSVAGTAVLSGAVLGAVGGVRLGDGADGWGGASVAVPLGRAAAVVVEAGIYPSDPLLEREGGRYATVGMRVRSH